MNLVGNTAMAVAHQGPFYLLPNLARSARVLLGKDKELRNRVLAEVGQGPTASLATEGTTAVSRGVRKFAEKEGRIADDWIRGSAWIHEARKAGIKDAEHQKQLLREAARGDKEARAIANEIRQRAADAMVDFERLGPTEKAFAHRFLFEQGAVQAFWRELKQYLGLDVLEEWHRETGEALEHRVANG
jgi:hypothetical protein